MPADTGGPSKSPFVWDARYRRVIDGVREAVIIDDRKGRIVFANKAFYELFGFEEGDLGHLNLEDYIAPEWQEKLRDRHDRRMRGDDVPADFEYEGIKRSGERMWLSVHVVEVQEDGELIGTQSAIRDMTAVKLAEERLRQANQNLADVIETLPLPINVLDRNGIVRIWNAAAERLFGWTAGEVIGHLYPLAPGDLNEEHRGMLKQAIASGRAYSGYETARRHKDGSLLDVAIWSAPLRNRKGEISSSLAVIADIRDRVQAHRDYKQLFETAHDAIVIFDPETEVVLEVNRRACELYGFEREHFIGLSLKTISPNVERGREAIARTLKRSTNTNYETVHLRKDGSELELEANASLVEYAGKPAILSIHRDLTQRRALEQELRHAQRMEAMGQLAGGVAHDFNNILAIVLGAAEMLGDEFGTPTTRQQIEEIKHATERGTRLTRQLLTFGRKQVVRPAHVDLRFHLQEMSGWLDRLIEDNIALRVDLGHEEAVVHADPGHIEQVVLNLVLNARDAMPDGGTLVISIQTATVLDASVGTVDPLPAGDYVVLSVSDSGTGMDERTKNRLFDPFFTTKAEGKGTGLGLATVYGITCQSDGGIRVESTPGEGTSFDLFLPRSGSHADPLLAYVEPEVARGSETILLVEDDDGVRYALERLLKAAGYQVAVAGGADEAVALFDERAEEIDLLLTDVLMPGRSGPELAAVLTEKAKHLRVLFISGFVDDLRREELAGAAVIQKPVTRAALTHEIRRLLD